MARNKKQGDQFWQHVRNYLTIYLPRIRDLSPRTVDSYRQSTAMYCSFLKEKSGIAFSQVSFDNVNRDSVVKFIRWLHEEKQCESSTCNLRLSSLKSFLKYCADEDISLYPVYQDVKKIPRMKDPKIPVEHLSDGAFKALVSQPDIRTEKGVRNKMIIILLYDTGARVQELVDIEVSDLHLEARNPFITVTGKGSKTRSIPLMDKTISHLKEYLRRFHTESVKGVSSPLFYSTRSGARHMLSTDAVSAMLKSYGEAAKRMCPDVPERVHPHLLRHTRAMHLYRSGMPLSYIAQFLGHASMNTTEIYASASIEMLRGAIEKADPEAAHEIPLWKNEESLKKLCGL